MIIIIIAEFNQMHFWQNMGICVWSDESQWNRSCISSCIFENLVRNIIIHYSWTVWTKAINIEWNNTGSFCE